MAKRAAAGALLVWLACAGVPEGRAQQAPPEVVDLAPVVVSGVQPGPGMWRVTNAQGHTLWILGTVSPLPARLDWRADEVKAVIASADAVLGPPGWTLDADVGFFSRLTLLPSAMKAQHDPQGRRLQEILPPELYARWQPLKARYLDEVGLSPRSGVGKLLEKAYKARGLTPVVTRVEVKVDDPRAALKEVRASPLQDVACLQRTLDVVEHQMPLLVERANAWAAGDIDALQQLALKSQYDACVGAIADSELGRRRGMTNLDARAAEKWMGAARTALAGNAVTFATVPVHTLVEPGGYLERLRQAGYHVESP
jgi:hypothetical protein